MSFKKHDPAKKALNRAAQINPYCAFVQSCRAQYKRDGSLSLKQIAALNDVVPPSDYDCRYDEQFEYDEWLDDGMDIPNLD